MRRCKTCKWWDVGGYAKGHGACCFNPPLPANSSSAGAGAAWPVTYESDWCGKYERDHTAPKHPPTTPQVEDHLE